MPREAAPKKRPRSAAPSLAEDPDDVNNDIGREHGIPMLVDEHDETSTISVIQKLLEVFNPAEGFLQMVRACGGPTQVIQHLMAKHCFSVEVLLGMYANEIIKANEPDASFGSAGARISVQPSAARSRPSPDNTWWLRWLGFQFWK